MTKYKFDFQYSEILIRLIIDPLAEILNGDKSLGVLLEGEIVNKGDEAVKYEVGDKILVRKDNARELESSFFSDDLRLIKHESSIVCKYQQLPSQETK